MDLNTKPAVVLQRGSAAQQRGPASYPRQRPPLQELHFGHEWDPHEKPTPAHGAKRPLERTLPGSHTASEAANAPSPTPPLVPSTLGGRPLRTCPCTSLQKPVARPSARRIRWLW